MALSPPPCGNWIAEPKKKPGSGSSRRHISRGSETSDPLSLSNSLFDKPVDGEASSPVHDHPTPPYTPPESIGIREGSGPLELSRGFDRLRIRCLGSSLSVRRSCAERPEKRERRHEHHLRPFRETAFAHAVGKGISAPGKMGGSAALGTLTYRMTKPHGVKKKGTRSCKKGFDLRKQGKEHIKQGMNHKAHFRRKRDAPG